jgi:hypothetical protein
MERHRTTVAKEDQIMTREQTEVEGTLIRGADGALYFIPQSELQAYQVPDTIAKEAEQVLTESMDVRGFDALFTSLTPPVFGVEALQRPLAKRLANDQFAIIEKPSIVSRRD